MVSKQNQMLIFCGPPRRAPQFNHFSAAHLVDTDLSFNRVAPILDTTGEASRRTLH